jgi:hypothetical protein
MLLLLHRATGLGLIAVWQGRCSRCRRKGWVCRHSRWAAASRSTTTPSCSSSPTPFPRPPAAAPCATYQRGPSSTTVSLQVCGPPTPLCSATCRHRTLNCGREPYQRSRLVMKRQGGQGLHPSSRGQLHLEAHRHCCFLPCRAALGGWRHAAQSHLDRVQQAGGAHLGACRGADGPGPHRWPTLQRSSTFNASVLTRRTPQSSMQERPENCCCLWASHCGTSSHVCSEHTVQGT